MIKRDVIRTVLHHQRPPYVPWALGFTHEATAKLRQHFGQADLELLLHNHLLGLGNSLGYFTELGNDLVQDVFALLKQYRGRLAFHGGLSTQRTLPYGTVDDVRRATQRLLEAGRDGGYIFAPAHAVEGDMPLENMLTFIEQLHGQPGYKQR